MLDFKISNQKNAHLFYLRRHLHKIIYVKWVILMAKHVGLGWDGAAFGKLRNIQKGDLTICLKRKIYEECVPCAPCNYIQCWNLNTKNAFSKKIKGCWTGNGKTERAMLGITRIDKEHKWLTSLTHTQAKWWWAGHIARVKDNRLITRHTTVEAQSR